MELLPVETLLRSTLERIQLFKISHTSAAHQIEKLEIRFQLEIMFMWVPILPWTPAPWKAFPLSAWEPQLVEVPQLKVSQLSLQVLKSPMAPLSHQARSGPVLQPATFVT